MLQLSSSRQSVSHALLPEVSTPSAVSVTRVLGYMLCGRAARCALSAHSTAGTCVELHRVVTQSLAINSRRTARIRTTKLWWGTADKSQSINHKHKSKLS